MARVVHFELAVDDPDRAAAFWRDAFGWEVRHFAEGGVMEANAAAR